MIRATLNVAAKFPGDADRVASDKALLDAAREISIAVAEHSQQPIEIARGFVFGRMLSIGIEAYIRAGVSREKIEEVCRDLVRHL